MLAAMSRPEYYGNPGGLTGDVEIVRAVYDAFARRDVDAMIRHIAPTCEMHLVATAAASGRSEPYRGHTGVREYFAEVAEVWDDLVLHAEDVRVIPGSVIVIGHATGHRGGTPVRRAAVWTWQVSDGLVTSVRVADLGDLQPPA
jgi:ketosteroid isomerase-like protein